MSYVESNEESDRSSTTAGNESGNGHAQSALSHSRQARAEAEHLAETLRLARGEWEQLLRQQLKERPYAALAVAVGVGYVIGGGLAPRIVHTLASSGSRLALGVLLQRVLATSNLDADQGATE
jgi:hypothetical protein